MSARTLYSRIWDDHVVDAFEDGSDLLYADRHIVHEVSTPQSFASLFAAGRRLRRPGAHLAVADHSVSTSPRNQPMPPGMQRDQILRLEENCQRTGMPLIPLRSRRQGIVHVIGPETGFTLPGLTLVCGDSHTSTHGAFGALAFGIGASECGVIFATQCIRQRRAKSMRIRVNGKLGPHVTAKDLALAIIARIGIGGAQGHAVHYEGETIDALSMEGRMTLCNMTIEAGSRLGIIAPDDRTYAYLEGRPLSPKGAMWEKALDHWRGLRSDADAVFDRDIAFDAATIAPHVTWGTNPEDAAPVGARVPDPAAEADPERRHRLERALAYMGLTPGTALEDIAIDRVFIGSCTNGRIEDLRAAAAVVAGRHVAARVSAMVVPGSGEVRAAAEAEGLDRIFRDAGFDWKAPGCSMCVGMNGDIVAPGQRCASTSNRNFEGRQGQGARTHLMSPAMAAAAALAGHIVDVRHLS
jgi:3-isopropylmalate/(R)-2-methylmalate dehydratase large subunit